ncbi:MAG: SBBP repeat-containing protein [Bacteroidota bacterium]|nr:SBBP repeat-containing protein [Bacteroidota bacterium]
MTRMDTKPQSISIRHIFIFQLFLFVLTFVQHTNAQQLLWQRVFNPGGQDEARGVAVDYEGNIIVTGTTDPTAIDYKNLADFFTVKYNSQGDTIWTRRFNVSSYDHARGVAVDKAGNIIVVGETTTDTATNGDIQVVKYNPNGDTLWTRRYGKPKERNSTGGVAIDSRGSIIITGFENSTEYGFYNYVTVKYDSNGTLLWTRWYIGFGDDLAEGIAVDDSDNVVVTGKSEGEMGWDWLTIKYSPGGDTVWTRRYDLSTDDKAHSVTIDKDGNIIICGELGNIASPNDYYGAVVKYNRQGDTLWTKKFNKLKNEGVTKFASVITNDYGDIFLTGTYFQRDIVGYISYNYYVAKSDSSGDTLWTRLYNYHNDDEPSGITVDKSGNVIVTGTANHSEVSFAGNFLTIKLNDISTDVNLHYENHQPVNFSLKQNYPNPFNPSTMISYQLPMSSRMTLKVYDILGKEIATLVDEKKEVGTYIVLWNASMFTSGVYIARLTSENFSASIKLLLVR